MSNLQAVLRWNYFIFFKIKLQGERESSIYSNNLSGCQKSIVCIRSGLIADIRVLLQLQNMIHSIEKLRIFIYFDQTANEMGVENGCDAKFLRLLVFTSN